MRVSPGWAEVLEGWGAEPGPWGLGKRLPSSTLRPASEGFSRDYRDDVAERLLTLKEGLVHPDSAILFHTCNSIAQVPMAAATKDGRAAVSGAERGSWAVSTVLPRALQGAATGHIGRSHSENVVWHRL